MNTKFINNLSAIFFGIALLAAAPLNSGGKEKALAALDARIAEIDAKALEVGKALKQKSEEFKDFFELSEENETGLIQSFNNHLIKEKPTKPLIEIAEEAFWLHGFYTFKQISKQRAGGGIDPSVLGATIHQHHPDDESKIAAAKKIIQALDGRAPSREGAELTALILERTAIQSARDHIAAKTDYSKPAPTTPVELAGLVQANIVSAATSATGGLGAARKLPSTMFHSPNGSKAFHARLKSAIDSDATTLGDWPAPVSPPPPLPTPGTSTTSGGPGGDPADPSSDPDDKDKDKPTSTGGPTKRPHRGDSFGSFVAAATGLAGVSAAAGSFAVKDDPKSGKEKSGSFVRDNAKKLMRWGGATFAIVGGTLFLVLRGRKAT